MAELITILKMAQLLSALSQLTPGNQASPSASARYELARSTAEVAEGIIKCYHPSAKFRSVDIVERPWSRGPQYNAEKSVLLRIRWDGTVRKDYTTVVALVQRGKALRAPVVEYTSAFHPSARCQLNNWVEVK